MLIIGLWVYHKFCDAKPVGRQTYSYLPSFEASPPLHQYKIILPGGKRHKNCRIIIIIIIVSEREHSLQAVGDVHSRY